MSYDPEPGASPEEQNRMQSSLDRIEELLKLILRQLELITEEELKEND